MALLEYGSIFRVWMGRMGYSEGTIKNYIKLIDCFLQWLEVQRLSCLAEVCQSDLEGYVRYLHGRPNQNGGGALSMGYIQNHINAIGLLDKYVQLSQQIKLLKGKLPVEQGLQGERAIVSQQEIKAIYQQTDDSPMGFRDRALLGLYYGCGLRSSEGIRVELKHIQYQKDLLYVLPGKSGRSRWVPISHRVKQDFTDYQRYARVSLLKEGNDHFLINRFGRAIEQGWRLNTRLKQLVEKAGINKKISLHCLRHSIATHLLQQGMPLEQISRFLGHRSLDSTQIYTRIAEEFSL